MELRQLKIQLLNRLLACDDPELLSAIARILELDHSTHHRTASDPSLEGEARDIQESLDKLFSTEE